MRIKSTKVFAKFMNDCFRAKGLNYNAYVLDIPEASYKFTTGVHPLDAAAAGDYSYKTGKYRVIVVEYPANHYACPRYITTVELQREARRLAKSGTVAVDAVRKMVIELCEI